MDHYILDIINSSLNNDFTTYLKDVIIPINI